MPASRVVKSVKRANLSGHRLRWQREHKRLLAERDQLRRMLVPRTLFLDESTDTRKHPIDRRDARDPAMRYRGVILHRLRLVNEALERITLGNFGRCAHCQEKLKAARLAEDPAMSLCNDCRRYSDNDWPIPRFVRLLHSAHKHSAA